MTWSRRITWHCAMISISLAVMSITAAASWEEVDVGEMQTIWWDGLAVVSTGTDSESEELIFSLGGTTGPDAYRNDLRMFNLSSATWTDVPAANPPRATLYRKIAVIGRKLYAYGGWGWPYLDVFDFETQTWTDLSSTASGTPPSAHSWMIFLSHGNSLFLFSGRSHVERNTNELRRYNVATATWTDLFIPSSGVVPPPRRAAEGAMAEGSLYVFGGVTDPGLLNDFQDDAGHLNDFHVYHIETAVWEDLSVPSSGSPPSHRLFHGMTVSAGKVYVFGGHTGANYFNDLHEYDIVSSTWTELSSDGNPVPPGRRGMGFFTVKDGLFLIGGNYYDDDVQRGVGLTDAYTFALAAVTGANCDDGKQNQGETGLDCGGPCGSCCGNGQVDPGEDCDDGNSVDTDTCSITCVACTEFQFMPGSPEIQSSAACVQAPFNTPLCQETRTHQQLDSTFDGRKGPNRGAVSGGLGKYMTNDDRFLSWMCLKNHECLSAPGVGSVSNDFMCFAYDEQENKFIPWGKQSDLRLF